MAARNPAPPPPTTTTSWCWRLAGGGSFARVRRDSSFSSTRPSCRMILRPEAAVMELVRRSRGSRSRRRRRRTPCPIVVLVVAVAAHPLSTRCPLAGECCTRVDHDYLPAWRGRSCPRPRRSWRGGPALEDLIPYRTTPRYSRFKRWESDDGRILIDDAVAADPFQHLTTARRPRRAAARQQRVDAGRDGVVEVGVGRTDQPDRRRGAGLLVVGMQDQQPVQGPGPNWGSPSLALSRGNGLSPC